MNEKRLLRAGERIINLEQMFNTRLGYTCREDTLPKRFLEEGASVVEIEEERLTDKVLEDSLIVDFEEVLDIY